MENVTENTNPVSVEKKVYRASSLSRVAQLVIETMTGDFNLQDVLNKYNEECLKLQWEPGNALRNVRVVVGSMVKDGSIVRVSKGRWIKKV